LRLLDGREKVFTQRLYILMKMDRERYDIVCGWCCVLYESGVQVIIHFMVAINAAEKLPLNKPIHNLMALSQLQVI
jgi:hypothetical protein